MRYINIHTHQQPQQQEQAIQNLHQQFEQVDQPGRYSLGLHPWFIDSNWQKQFKMLEQFADHKQAVAIGECGLDKICTTDINLQQQVFEQQIQLANRIGKPLIIHCVKAYVEVLLMLKKATVPVVFHGFAKTKALALQLIRAGHYLSFGRALQQPRMQELVAALPLNRIFLETDDIAIPIADIYRLAANAFSIEEDLLSLQLEKNVLTFFNF